jgi:hypothetical protein
VLARDDLGQFALARIEQLAKREHHLSALGQ